MQMQEKIIEKWQRHKQLFLEYHKEVSMHDIDIS